MNTIFQRLILALPLFVLFAFSESHAAGPKMPNELANVSMGMSVDALLKARPKIKREGMLGAPIKWDAPKFVLYETLPAGEVFTSASFVIDEGKLAAATIVGFPGRGDEAKVRRKLIKECVSRWGKAYRKRVPKDRLRPGEVVPTLTWQGDGVEYVLVLPKRPKKDDTKINPITIQVRTQSAIEREPWKEAEMTPREKSELFDAHDVAEK